MRNLIFIITALSFGNLWVHGQAPLKLSLEEALNRAKEANFQYLIAEEDVEATRENANIARSMLLPNLNFEGSQTRSMSPNVGSFADSIPGIPRRNFIDRFDAVIRAQMAIIDVEARDNWRISQISTDVAEFQLQSTVQDILQQIANAYMTHWRNERRLEVIDANLERDQVLLEIARDQKEAGVATPLDVTRAEVQLANNEFQRLQQETRVLESSLNIKRILNFKLGRPLELAKIPIPEETVKADYNDRTFRWVLTRRPEYLQARRALEREKLSVDAAGRERLPSVNLTGQWGYASTSIEEDQLEQWNIGIGVSMPIFEGHRISSKKRQALANQRRQEHVLDEVEQEIESELRLALQDLQSRFNQVEVARKRVNLNNREFELARIRFEEGVADNRDVVDAQAALAEAEDSLVEAEYQYLLSRVKLARISGNVRNALQARVIDP